jgi:hypothetical protein
MAEMSPGAALRQLQQAQAGLKKARQALRIAREDPAVARSAFRLGWGSLAQAHRLLAAIPASAATEPVMTKQLSVERYATALLVRLRRLVRGGAVDEADAQDDHLEIDGDDS